MATPYHQVIDDTIYTHTHPTPKLSHALARPGYCLEEDADSSVKVRQHAHVARCLTQALIARP